MDGKDFFDQVFTISNRLLEMYPVLLFGPLVFFGFRMFATLVTNFLYEPRIETETPTQPTVEAEPEPVAYSGQFKPEKSHANTCRYCGGATEWPRNKCQNCGAPKMGK